MVLDNVCSDREAHPGTFVLLTSIQPLEHLENLFEVRLFNPNPIVAQREMPLPIFLSCGQAHTWLDPTTGELQRIADEVLKDLGQLCPITQDGWQRVIREFCFRFAHSAFQAEQSFPQWDFQGDGL